MQVLTLDKKIYTLKDYQIQHSILFQDLSHTILGDPLEILVHSKVFDIVLDFMATEHRVFEDPSRINVTQKERNFFEQYDIDTIIDVCSAANYLCYHFLLEVSANVVAEYFRNKDMEELNTIFGNDMNENEKRSIAREFDWIPDKDDL